MNYFRPVILSFVTISVLQAGVLDGIFSGNVVKPNVSSVLGSIKSAAGNNLTQAAAGLVPQEVMELCYDYKPKTSSANASGICDALKGGIDPCGKAPNLSLYGYTKKASDPLFKKELEGIRSYCQSLAGDTAKKLTVPEAIKGYSASTNTRATPPPNSAAIYGASGLLGWDNIKAYSANGASVTNNYNLYKAVSTNDYLSFKYYQDVLENSVGNGSGARKVNVFSVKELKDVTVNYKTMKDYDDDVTKIANVLKTSSSQAGAVRISSVSESEMTKAELEAQTSGANPETQKESISNSKLNEINTAVDNDVNYKIRYYKDVTVNPNNRIVYPAKGYVDSLPQDKKIIAVKKIEMQAKKDAMLEASLIEVGEMRKEVARLVMENAKISSRQFNAKQAKQDIDQLIQ